MTTSGVPERQAVSERLTEMWSRILRRDVAPQDDFFDSGGDSMTAVRMIVEVQTAFGVQIDVESFFEAASVERLTEAVLAAAGSPQDASPQRAG